MVYQSPDPKVENNVVVGVLYQIGHPNAFLSKVECFLNYSMYTTWRCDGHIQVFLSDLPILSNK